MSGKVYEARGAVIHKLPVETKTETGVQISIGFPVCTLSEWCDDQGETVAEIMNRGEAYASSQAGIERLRTAVQKLLDHWDENSGPEKRGEFEGVEYWSPAGRMVSTEFIVEIRAALSGSKDTAIAACDEVKP